MTALSEISETLSALTSFSVLGQASSLLGREVTADVGDEASPLVGVVEAVEMLEGQPLLRIGDDRIPPSAVLRVR